MTFTIDRKTGRLIDGESISEEERKSLAMAILRSYVAANPDAINAALAEAGAAT